MNVYNKFCMRFVISSSNKKHKIHQNDTDYIIVCTILNPRIMEYVHKFNRLKNETNPKGLLHIQVQYHCHYKLNFKRNVINDRKNWRNIFLVSRCTDVVCGHVQPILCIRIQIKHFKSFIILLNVVIVILNARF